MGMPFPHTKTCGKDAGIRFRVPSEDMLFSNSHQKQKPNLQTEMSATVYWSSSNDRSWKRRRRRSVICFFGGLKKKEKGNTPIQKKKKKRWKASQKSGIPPKSRRFTSLLSRPWFFSFQIPRLFQFSMTRMNHHILIATIKWPMHLNVQTQLREAVKWVRRTQRGVFLLCFLQHELVFAGDILHLRQVVPELALVQQHDLLLLLQLVHSTLSHGHINNTDDNYSDTDAAGDKCITDN